MPNQLESLESLNLTQVSVSLVPSGARTVRFVTAEPYRGVVLRVLSITRLWTNGEITQDEAVVRIVRDIPHVPVFGNAQDIQDYVDSRDGHHVHADYCDNTIYVGHNEHKDTWGHVTIGGRTKDFVWGNGAEINGPYELSAETYDNDCHECGSGA